MKTIKSRKRFSIAVLAFFCVISFLGGFKAYKGAFAAEENAQNITFSETKLNVSKDGTKMLIVTAINNAEQLKNVSELGYTIDGYNVADDDFAEKTKYYSTITLGADGAKTAKDIGFGGATDESKLLIWEITYTAGKQYTIAAYATVQNGSETITVNGTLRTNDCSDNSHRWERREGFAATCTAAGEKEHYVCKLCNKIAVESDGVKTITDASAIVIEALGHQEIPHAAQAPTCTESGWEAYVTCGRCDYTTKVEIPASGHDYDESNVCRICHKSYEQIINELSVTRATIEATARNGNIVLVSKEKPSASAKSVTVRFKVKSHAEPDNDSWLWAGAVNGKFESEKDFQFRADDMNLYGASGTSLPENLCDYGFSRWTRLKKIFNAEYTHTYFFDFEKNTYTITITDQAGNPVVKIEKEVFYNGEAIETIPMGETARTYEDPLNQYFGFRAYTSSFKDRPFSATFDFKCFDSTGKDLGLQTKGEYSTLHKHNLTVSQQAPTCTANGYFRATCDGCDYNVDKVLPTSGHDYNESNVCKNCQKTYEQIINELSVTRASINVNKDTDDAVCLITKEKPSANAKSVTVEFTVSQSMPNNGNRLYGAVNGKFSTENDYQFRADDMKTSATSEVYGAALCDYGFANWVGKAYFQEGYTHIYTFDFVNNTYTVIVKDGNGVVQTKDAEVYYPDGTPVGNLFGERERIYDDLLNQYFGFRAYTRNSSSEWTAAFDFKCYDSTGKDLGLRTISSDNATLSSVS